MTTKNTKVKSQHLPAYMPRSEDALLNWLENYFNTLPVYISAMQLDGNEVTDMKTMFHNLKRMRNNLNTVRDFAKAMTEIKRQLFYNAANEQTTVPQYEHINWPTTQMPGGLIRIVDAYNKRVIIPHALYDDTIGKALGLIAVPLAAIAMNPKDLKASTRITCDGSAIIIRTPIVKPATGQVVYVDKNDGKGWQLFAMNNKATCICYPELPESEAFWKFKVVYTIKGKEVGTAATEKVLVKRP